MYLNQFKMCRQEKAKSEVTRINGRLRVEEAKDLRQSLPNPVEDRRRVARYSLII